MQIPARRQLEQNVQQANRIGAARHRHTHTLARLEHVVACDGMDYALEHSPILAPGRAGRWRAGRDDCEAKQGNSFVKLFETRHRSVEAFSQAHLAFGRSQPPCLYFLRYSRQLGNWLTEFRDENFFAGLRFSHQPREPGLGLMYVDGNRHIYSMCSKNRVITGEYFCERASACPL